MSCYSLPSSACLSLLTGAGEECSYATVISAMSCYSLPSPIVVVSLAAPETVLQAVVAKFDANPTLVCLLPGGLHAEEVPEGTDLPFGFVTFQRAGYLHTFENSIESANVALHVYAPGMAHTEEILNELKRVYDWSALPFGDPTTGRSIRVMPTGKTLDSALARWKRGELIYHGCLYYNVWVGRN